ncbi:MAG: HDOD domain-containing protein [bacterium]|nr:HDOD domain-containing protein [bacterium]
MATAKRDLIADRLKEIHDLPTLPNVFLNIMRVMRNPKVSIKEIALVVESDPAISMKILRLINSSFYGLSRTIDSVQQAIVLLGSNTLRNVVISVSIFKALDDHGKKAGFNREAFWQHSICCGVVARYIGRQLGNVGDEEGFIAGIIHDIGKVVLDRYFQPEMQAVMTEIRAKNLSFYEAERNAIGISHMEIGAYLAENWNLPEKLVTVIAQHHKIDPESPHAPLTALIQLSDMIVRKYKIGSGGDDLVPNLEPHVFTSLNFGLDRIDSWDEALKEELVKGQELLEGIFR